MINEITFRYNKHSQISLYVSLILGVVIGMMLCRVILDVSGVLNENMQEVPDYFKNNPQHAVFFIFGTLALSVIFGAGLAFWWWRSKDEEASLKMWKEYAVLYYKGEEIPIHIGELDIEVVRARAGRHCVYILNLPNKKIMLNASRIEKYDAKRKYSSLEVAMNSLMHYRRTKDFGDTLVKFYDMELILNITTLDVFSHSPYYLDVHDVITMPEEGCAVAMIRERDDPTHVVGDVQFDIRALERSDLDESRLKNQVIEAIIELDERVEL